MTTDNISSALFELLRNANELLSYLSNPAVQVKARLFDHTNLCNSIDKALRILSSRSESMTYLIDIGDLSALIFQFHTLQEPQVVTIEVSKVYGLKTAFADNFLLAKLL